MSNCNDTCRPGFIPGPPSPNYASGCNLDCTNPIKTYVLPASVGDDTAGQPYAPHIGEYHNAIVIYEANGNIYFYDSLGTPTLIEKGDPNNAGGIIAGPKVTQGVGDSTTSVMSQKSVSYEFERVATCTAEQDKLIQALQTTVKAMDARLATLEAKQFDKEIGA